MSIKHKLRKNKITSKDFLNFCGLLRKHKIKKKKKDSLLDENHMGFNAFFVINYSV